jgi:hypothetical protein
MDACHQNDKQGVSQVPEIMRLEENTPFPDFLRIGHKPFRIIIHRHPHFPKPQSSHQYKNPSQDGKVVGLASFQ